MRVDLFERESKQVVPTTQSLLNAPLFLERFTNGNK